MFRIDRNSVNPQLISIFTGDICNLACALCEPEASTRWQYEVNFKKPVRTELSIDSVDFTGATSITFGGGEPILNRSTLPLLKKINNNIAVSMHLNGTVLPSDEILNECAKFENMTFILSIDDIEEQFEFLRYPAKWNTVVDNIHWLINNSPANIKFSVNTLISVLNESTYTRVLNWVKQNMPADTAWHTNESNGILNRFSYQKTIEYDIDYLDRIDKRRGTDWKKTFPAAAKYLYATVKTTTNIGYSNKLCDIPSWKNL